MNDYVYIGKIVNTHGIRGEIRLLSNFSYKMRVFKNGVTIYIGRDKVKEVIASYRKHKCFDMITLEGYTNINEVLKYKGALCYVLREDLNFRSDEYLNEDLIGLPVVKDGNVCGKVIEIEQMSEKNSVLWILADDKKIAVPFVSEFVNVDIEKRQVEVFPIAGLFE